MLDTIRVSAQVEIDYWDYLNGWRFDSQRISQCKLITLPNGATIYMEYYLLSRQLTLCFSASRIQHGTNAVPFNFEVNKVTAFKNILEKSINDELYVVLSCDDLMLCRLDINRDFSFQREKHADAVMAFLNKVLPARYEKRKKYKTGITSQNKKAGLRVYRKDKHPKTKKKMKPTVRLELQLDRKRIERTFGFRPSLSSILQKEVLAEVWDRLLQERGLDNPILNQSQLYKEARKYLTRSQFNTLRQMNDNPTFADKRQRRKQLEVVRKLKAAKLCPYSCEVPIKLIMNDYTTITNNSKEGLLCSKQYAIYINYPAEDATATKWYIDTS
jgi:hypothetical protein